MKLIMMRGLPACGKSTYAKELMETDGAYVRVNKDLLREMMNFGTYSPDNEVLIKKAEVEIAEMALSQGKSVIVDDTNLGEKYEDYWKKLATAWEVEIEIVDLMKQCRFVGSEVIPLDMPELTVQDCVRRDFGRGSTVGGDVIEKMAKQFGYE